MSRFVFMADVVADQKERGRFRGIASSTSPDRKRQVISEKALADMATAERVPLSSGTSHEGAVMMVESQIGVVSGLLVEEVEEGQRLVFDGKLNPKHPAFDFYCDMLDPDSEFAFDAKVSVGGWVDPNAVRREHKAGVGIVEVLDSFRLDHVLFCRSDSAINQDCMIVGMAGPTDFKGSLFGAASADAPPTDEDAAGKAGAPPSVDELRRQVRFELERRELSSPDDYLYVAGIYANGTVVYEKQTEGGYGTFVCKWAYGDGKLSLTEGEQVVVKVETIFTTPDGEVVDIFKAGPVATDDLGDDVLAGFADSGASTKPWGKVDKSKLPKSSFLYVGDVKKKDTWKFPVYEADGTLNANGLEAAAQRLSSTTDEVRRVVEPKVRKLYKKLGKPLPSSLAGKAEADGGSDMLDKETAVGLRDVLQGLLEKLTGKSEPDAAEAEGQVTEPDETSEAVVETGEPVGRSEAMAEAAFTADGIQDAVNAAVSTTLQPFMDALATLAAPPETAAEAPAGKSEAETEDSAEADTAESEEITPPEGGSEEVSDAGDAAEVADTETPGDGEPLTGLAADDVADLNRTLQTIWAGFNDLKGAVESLGGRVDALDMVGKSTGGTSQAPPPGTAPASQSETKGVGPISAFVLGG